MSTKNRPGRVPHEAEDPWADFEIPKLTPLEPAPMVDMVLIAEVTAAGTRLDCMRALSFLMGYLVPEAANGNPDATFVLRLFVDRYPRYRDAILINVPDLFPGRSFMDH